MTPDTCGYCGAPTVQRHGIRGKYKTQSWIVHVDEKGRTYQLCKTEHMAIAMERVPRVA